MTCCCRGGGIVSTAHVGDAHAAHRRERWLRRSTSWLSAILFPWRARRHEPTTPEMENAVWAWEVFQMVATIVSCVEYAAETNYIYAAAASGSDEYVVASELPFAFYVINVTVLAIFAVDWVLRFFAADRKAAYVFSWFSLLDIVVIVPSALTASFGIVSISATATRLLRVLRIGRVLSSFAMFYEGAGNTQSGVRMALLRPVLFVVCATYIGAGVFLILEQDLASELGYPPPSPPLTYVDALYFLVVTIASVGYGDISPTTWAAKVFTVLFLLVVIIVLPQLLAEFSRVYAAQSLYMGGFAPSKDSGPHILVLGALAGSEDVIAELLQELHREGSWELPSSHRLIAAAGAHGRKGFGSAELERTPALAPLRDVAPTAMRPHSASDRSLGNTRITLVMGVHEPDERLQRVLKHPDFDGRVRYARGSCVSSRDLERVSVGAAAAVFVLADTAEHQPRGAAPDAAAALVLVTLRSCAPGVPVFMLSRTALAATVLEPHDALNSVTGVTALASDELQASMLALSARVVGASTLLINLMRSPLLSPSELHQFALPPSVMRPLEAEYACSAPTRAFMLRAPAALDGHGFTRAALALYAASGGFVVVLGAREPTVQRKSRAGDVRLARLAALRGTGALWSSSALHVDGILTSSSKGVPGELLLNPGPFYRVRAGQHLVVLCNSVRFASAGLPFSNAALAEFLGNCDDASVAIGGPPRTLEGGYGFPDPPFAAAHGASGIAAAVHSPGTAPVAWDAHQVLWQRAGGVGRAPSLAPELTYVDPDRSSSPAGFDNAVGSRGAGTGAGCGAGLASPREGALHDVEFLAVPPEALAASVIHTVRRRNSTAVPGNSQLERAFTAPASSSATAPTYSAAGAALSTTRHHPSIDVPAAGGAVNKPLRLSPRGPSTRGGAPARDALAALRVLDVKNLRPPLEGHTIVACGLVDAPRIVQALRMHIHGCSDRTGGVAAGATAIVLCVSHSDSADELGPLGAARLVQAGGVRLVTSRPGESLAAALMRAGIVQSAALLLLMRSSSVASCGSDEAKVFPEDAGNSVVFSYFDIKRKLYELPRTRPGFHIVVDLPSMTDAALLHSSSNDSDARAGNAKVRTASFRNAIALMRSRASRLPSTPRQLMQRLGMGPASVDPPAASTPSPGSAAALVAPPSDFLKCLQRLPHSRAVWLAFEPLYVSGVAVPRDALPSLLVAGFADSYLLELLTAFLCPWAAVGAPSSSAGPKPPVGGQQRAAPPPSPRNGPTAEDETPHDPHWETWGGSRLCIEPVPHSYHGRTFEDLHRDQLNRHATVVLGLMRSRFSIKQSPAPTYNSVIVAPTPSMVLWCPPAALGDRMYVLRR